MMELGCSKRGGKVSKGDKESGATGSNAGWKRKVMENILSLP
jgi:hypothetical protein